MKTQINLQPLNLYTQQKREKKKKAFRFMDMGGLAS